MSTGIPDVIVGFIVGSPWIGKDQDEMVGQSAEIGIDFEFDEELWNE